MVQLFQGVLQAQSSTLPDKQSLVRLWLHESARVFRDRLSEEKVRACVCVRARALQTFEPQDRAWFDGACGAEAERHLGAKLSPEQFRDSMFGDLLRPQEKTYMEMPDLSALRRCLTEQRQEYSISFTKPLDLVRNSSVNALLRNRGLRLDVAFRPCACARRCSSRTPSCISRASRAFCGSRAAMRCSLVWAAPAGTASRALLRSSPDTPGERLPCRLPSGSVAAWADGSARSVALEITRGFGVAEWRDALRSILMTAGAENKVRVPTSGRGRG